MVSDSAKDLINKLLVKDIKKRLSPAQALQHKWFKETLKQDKYKTPLGIETIERLQNFRGQSKLKKAAMNMLIKMSDAKEIEGLRAVFDEIDADKSGLISKKEL